MASPDVLREDLPFWTQEEFDRLDQIAALKGELVGSHPDEHLLDGKTPRAHLQDLLGEEVASRLIGV